MLAATDLGFFAWMSEGACRREDPDLFFPLGEGGANTEQIRRATSICHRCEVEAKCLRFALINGVTDGIWGGRTGRERQAMIRKRQRNRRRTRTRRGPNRRPGTK